MLFHLGLQGETQTAEKGRREERFSAALLPSGLASCTIRSAACVSLTIRRARPRENTTGVEQGAGPAFFRRRHRAVGSSVSSSSVKTLVVMMETTPSLLATYPVYLTPNTRRGCADSGVTLKEGVVKFDGSVIENGKLYVPAGACTSLILRPSPD